MSIGLLARPLTSCAGPTATRGSARLDYVRYSSFIITSIVVLGKPASWALSRKLPIRPCIGHSTATLIIVSTFQLGVRSTERIRESSKATEPVCV